MDNHEGIPVVATREQLAQFICPVLLPLRNGSAECELKPGHDGMHTAQWGQQTLTWI